MTKLCDEKTVQVWNDAVEEFNQWLAENPTVHPCYDVNMTDEERAEIQLMIDAA